MAVVERSKYVSLSNIIALLDLIGVFVLALVGKMDLITAAAIGVLAIAFLVRNL